MKIVYTGATGLIGFNFVKAAAEAGHSVVAVCGKNIKPDNVEKYGESFVKNGSLGAMSGEEFMRLVLGLK